MQDLVTFPPTSTLSQSKDLDQQLILGTQTQVTLPLSNSLSLELSQKGKGGGW
jgi:hypothetical protein